MAEKKKKPYEIGELDQYLFGQGNHYEIYEKLGAHLVQNGKQKGVYFAVWAPHAQAVSVVGEFNEWDTEANPMKREEPLGIYTCFIPGVKKDQMYKYCIETYSGEQIFKADPYANYAELRPGTASRVADIENIKWTDTEWMTRRKTWNHKHEPMSVYEAHIGSWMRHPGREDEGFYTYREFARAITKYIKEMGYTHVELMGIAEHPFDGSWGYQVTGYYAPTSRYGSPEDFAWMINYLHRNKIGIILDWVPAHFPKDAHGLADFDGTPTYEYADPRLGEHPDWGTKVFDFGKNEVRNFLISNALFWVEKFHIDGLRVDAVASMLYLDYGRKDGEWVANKYGENKNLEAIDFFRHLNSVVLGRNPGALMIAEESTAWPQVTGDVEEGGLGFSLKWNMGWMHDFTEYMKLDPYFRKDNHHLMTFAMSYAYSENYILVLSHDEVVHTKSSMIGKMPGDVWQSFANLRLSYGFMMGHPGKKLLFMGGEFAQYSEWSEARSLDWHLLQYADHQEMQAYVKELNHLYTEEPAFWAEDFDPNGFQWIECDDAESSIVSFVRRSKEKELVFLCNFTPVVHRGFSLGVPQEGVYHERLNSDAARFGGSDVINAVPLQSKAEPAGRCPFRVELDVPPLGMVILEREQPKKQPRTKKPKTRTAANGTKTDAKRKHPEKNTEKTAKQADLP